MLRDTGLRFILQYIDPAVIDRATVRCPVHVASCEGPVYAVGSNLDAATGDMHPALYTSAGGGAFSFVQTPNRPACGDTILGGVTLAGDTWWVVGLYGSNAHLTLIENHQQT